MDLNKILSGLGSSGVLGGFSIEADTGAQSRGLVLVQAMIAAACSDGHLDGGERTRIMQRVEELELAPDEKAMLFDALGNPLSLADLCQMVNCPELAAEMYLCSLVVLDQEQIGSGIYLDALAHRLAIPPELVQQLKNNVEWELARSA